jgi:peptidoglycan/LPS O-acetylase OafA/YrhL
MRGSTGDATDPRLPAAAAFAAAALVHFGLLVHGYQHRQARVAESVIALVLLAGLVLSWVRPAWTREAGIAAQGFALLGTLVGIFTIIVGVGPRTAPDVVYHLAIVAVLLWGLLVAVRTPANHASQQAGLRSP